MLCHMKKIALGLIAASLLLSSGLVYARTRQVPTAHPTTEIETVNHEEPADSPYKANHRNVLTTWFRAGTPAGVGDRGTSNVGSAWYKDWAKHLGGADTGQLALVRAGHDNLYYFALPCPDYDERGVIANHLELARQAGLTIPATLEKNQSAFKNLWIQVKYGDKIVYAQWEDVGPLGPNVPNDCSYVFGDTRAAQEKTKTIDSALDLSPSAFTHLQPNLDRGIIKASWAFVAADDVPAGPWKENVTTAGPDWQ